MHNIYQIKNRFCSSSLIALTVEGHSQTVAFVNRRKNGLLVYETDNETIQSAIENLSRYKNGEIERIEGASPKVGTTPVKVPIETKADEPIKAEAKVTDKVLSVDELPVIPVAMPEVTSWQAAKEILRSEPYNVAFQSLSTPENILKKAAELGVSFPNLAL